MPAEVPATAEVSSSTSSTAANSPKHELASLATKLAKLRDGHNALKEKTYGNFGEITISNAMAGFAFGRDKEDLAVEKNLFNLQTCCSAQLRGPLHFLLRAGRSSRVTSFC